MFRFLLSVSRLMARFYIAIYCPVPCMWEEDWGDLSLGVVCPGGCVHGFQLPLPYLWYRPTLLHPVYFDVNLKRALHKV